MRTFVDKGQIRSSCLGMDQARPPSTSKTRKRVLQGGEIPGADLGLTGDWAAAPDPPSLYGLKARENGIRAVR
jgi:hypothetical protein